MALTLGCLIHWSLFHPMNDTYVNELIDRLLEVIAGYFWRVIYGVEVGGFELVVELLEGHFYLGLVVHVVERKHELLSRVL